MAVKFWTWTPETKVSNTSSEEWVEEFMLDVLSTKVFTNFDVYPWVNNVEYMVNVGVHDNMGA